MLSSLFTKLKQGLTKTRQQMTQAIANTLLGEKFTDAQILEEIETQLLLADVGVSATEKIIDQLIKERTQHDLRDAPHLFQVLNTALLDILKPSEQAFNISTHQPFIILMVGINGAGKTTTIGKLAKRLQGEGKSVLLAAGDTFRAAAIEQLQVWGERNHIPVISGMPGGDSAAIIFDALNAAKARNIDVVIADTAGRLHTQQHLMDELAKIKRVIRKFDASAPHEVMLVLDAGIGQNALQQAKQFQAAVEVSGITVTKLDGTAKGGIVFAMAEELHLPIRFIGVGEAIDDLRPFVAEDFVQALLTVPQT
ncbi:MAG: signal recognition particle-docking protein FtsY [Gammaproteobacteria bacterium]|jgi:fused signal recognition particle receptor